MTQQLNPDWVALNIYEWLQEKKYRAIQHRHNGTFRAIDESESKYMEADTLPLLADALLNWATDAKPFRSDHAVMPGLWQAGKVQTKIPGT